MFENGAVPKPVLKGVAQVPVVMQMEARECGAASLTMVMHYYHLWIPLEQARVDCGVSMDGANAKNILAAARSYGMKANAWRVEPEDLLEEGPFPCIVHWGFNHFVVLCGFKGKRAVLHETPQACRCAKPTGRRKTMAALTEGEFIWKKIKSLEWFNNGERKCPKDIDLIIGGPSCQGFSRAGRRKKDDPRNMLFGEYVRVINEIRPRYIVLENVEGFMDMQFMGYKGITGIQYKDGSVTPNILRNELKEIGYHTLEPKILNAADFGVPQRRNRAIFIGYRDGEKTPNYPMPTTAKKQLTLQDAVGDLITDPAIRNSIPESKYQKECKKGRTPDINGKPIPVGKKLSCTEL